MGLHGRHIKGKSSILKHLDFVALDILALVMGFVLASFVKFRNFGFLHSGSWRGILVVCCLIDLMVILFSSPFSSILRRYGSDELLQTLKQMIRNFILCCLVLYVFKCEPDFSRTVIILTYVFYCGISLCLRMGWKRMIKASLATPDAKKSIFVVGTKDNISQSLATINSGFLHQYNVKGVCVIDGQVGETVQAQIDILDARGVEKVVNCEFKNVVDVDHISEYVLQHHIDEVFIGTNSSVLSHETYRSLNENGKEIHFQIQPMLGFVPEDQYISTVGTYRVLTIGNHTLDGKQMVYIATKRVLDIILGLIGTLALVPLILIVKVSYLASGDTKSIFYTQSRVGLNGKVFKLYKFRSMIHNADEVLKEMLKDSAYKKEWEEKQKFDHDPRITKIGNFLRKTSLDEIPQVLNVLKGDMSIIGPRPLIVGELEEHGGLQKYNDVKPGITGWWGCNGRSNTTYEERLSLEYHYVDNCSLYLDLLCFVKTIAVVLKRDGAQ